MTKFREESQSVVSLAVSGALLLLLSLGYLFVPRSELEGKSPLSVLISPNKKFSYECVDYRIPQEAGISEYLIANNFEEECIKYAGRWISISSTGLGRADIGSLLSKDLPATGGLLLLIGASPALGFFVFQRIRGSRK
jgi:hypothetical protein